MINIATNLIEGQASHRSQKSLKRDLKTGDIKVNVMGLNDAEAANKRASRRMALADIEVLAGSTSRKSDFKENADLDTSNVAPPVITKGKESHNHLGISPLFGQP